MTPLRHHFVLLRLGSPSAYLAFALMAHGEVEFAASGVVAVLFRHSRCPLVVVPGAPQLAQHCAAVDKREAATDVGSWCGIPTSISLCCDKTSFSHGELLQVYCGVYGLLKSNRTMRRQSSNIPNQHKALHKETERERERERETQRERERERQRESYFCGQLDITHIASRHHQCEFTLSHHHHPSPSTSPSPSPLNLNLTITITLAPQPHHHPRPSPSFIIFSLSLSLSLSL